MIIRRVLWTFNHLEELLSSSLLFLVFIFLAYTVIGRALGLPTTEAQEVIQYGFVISILFGISYATKEREHIRADIILDNVPEKIKGIMLIAADAVWLFLSLSIVWYGVPFVRNMMIFPQSTPILQVPYWYFYIMVPISAGLTSIRIVQINILKFMNRST